MKELFSSDMEELVDNNSTSNLKVEVLFKASENHLLLRIRNVEHDIMIDKKLELKDLAISAAEVLFKKRD
jgi:hypothetical protein